ncbi:MAG: efflux RND transporter permease subunit [Akkermansiaceae bacterium]
MIDWFARNHLAANLMIAIILLLGAHSVWKRTTLEVNPAFRFDEVHITVNYRGGTPSDVERAVVIPIERAIENLPGIESIESEARSGSARIEVKADQLTDPEKLMEQMRPLIAGITNFPAEIEPPRLEVPNSTRWFDVIKVAITGNMSEADLLKAARRVRDDLTELPGISQAELQGNSPLEISIEADPDRLRDYGLTYNDLAEAVRRTSLDLPAGQIQTDEGSLMIRTSGQAFTEDQFADIILLNNRGAAIKLGDVAKVTDGFEENRKILRFNGEPALLVECLRLNNESALEIAQQVKDYVARAPQRFPSGISLHIWDDSTIELKGRMNSLISTLLQGCILVMIVLGLFLRPSIAFWVLMGIPVAFAGTLWVMPFFGLTVNVMSLFGFIIAVGLVVDDAIVTSENVFTKMNEGMDPEEAAIRGTQEIAMPVTFGTLTTIVAFLPLMFFEGFYGTYTKQVPPVIIGILLFSLLEAKLSLPAHLKYIKPLPRNPGPFARMQNAIANGLESFIENRFRPLILFTTRHRYSTCCLFIAFAMASVALIKSGRLGFVSVPNIEKNRLFASITMPRDAKVEDTEVVVKRAEMAAEKLRQEMVDPGTGKSLIRDILTSSGGWPGRPGVDARTGYVIMTIVDATERTVPGPSAKEISKRWRELSGEMPEAQSFYIMVDSGRGFRGAGGEESIQLELRGPASEARDQLADEIEVLMKSYEGIESAGGNLGRNRDELVISIRPEGEALGLTQRELGRQVRSSFFGEQAQRVQRDIDDIRVMVRLPLEKRQSLHTLENMKIRLPRGGEVPLTSVADVNFAKARSEISRTNGAQAITLWAQAENSNVDIIEIGRDLQKRLGEIFVDHPELSWRFVGYLAEHEQTNERIILGAVAILLALYVLLVIPFKSLLQPFYVLLAIPFGVIGALLGHLIIDVVPSFLSAFGILAVAGIVVNNAIVMIDYINQHRAAGMDRFEAVIGSGTKRFRPILLTSLTTFVGLVPTMLDRSVQGQFLIPMAVSLAFGILFSTVITLFLIPSFYLITESMIDHVKKFWFWYLGKKPEAIEGVE